MKITRIYPRRTALLIIDMQNDFVKPGGPIFIRMGYEMVEPLAAFIDRCRDVGMLIIYTKNVLRKDGRDMGKLCEFCDPIKEGAALVDGTPGGEIYEAIAPKDTDIVIKKQKYSSFYGTGLDNILAACKIETVVITGVCTEVCCFSTARDAGFRNYDVAFISDLTGTADYHPDRGYGAMTGQEMQRATLINLALTTAHVMTKEEFFSLVERPQG